MERSRFWVLKFMHRIFIRISSILGDICLKITPFSYQWLTGRINHAVSPQNRTVVQRNMSIVEVENVVMTGENEKT